MLHTIYAKLCAKFWIYTQRHLLWSFLHSIWRNIRFIIFCGNTTDNWNKYYDDCSRRSSLICAAILINRHPTSGTNYMKNLPFIVTTNKLWKSSDEINFGSNNLYHLYQTSNNVEKKIIIEALLKLSKNNDLELTRLMGYGGKNLPEWNFNNFLQKKKWNKNKTFSNFLIIRRFIAFRITLDFVTDLTMSSSKTFTLFQQAVHESNFEMVYYLLDKGADVNAIDFKADTPLHITADADTKIEIAIIELLLQFIAKKKKHTSKKSHPWALWSTIREQKLRQSLYV